MSEIGRVRNVGFSMRNGAKQTPGTDVKIVVNIPVASVSLVMVDDTIRHVLPILERQPDDFEPRGPKMYIRSKLRPANLRPAGFGVCLLCVLGAVGAFAQAQPPLPPVRPPELSSPPKSDEAPPAAPAPSSPAAPSAPPQAAAEACLEELRASHVEAEPAPEPSASSHDCGIVAPVRISSVGLSGGAKLDLPAHPLLECSFAVVFTGFLRDLVAPLGEAVLGASVVALDTGPGYYCRGVDWVAGAKVSPHGKGIAIDVSAFQLADRRRIAIGHEANPQEALFLRTIRRAGCGWFTTILGPGDPDHAEHFHFDILRHGASDNYRICQ